MNILRNIYKYPTATLILHKKSRKSPIREGLRQGHNFSNAIHCMLREGFKLSDLWEGLAVKFNGAYLNNLRFADDILLFSNTGDELQRMISN